MVDRSFLRLASGSLRFADLAAVGLILACLAADARVLNVGIDDLDEGYFAQQATRVATYGQVPYRDFESLYTPGLVYLHAALFSAAGGPDLLAMRWLSLLARGGLALALFAIARPLVRGPLWAAAPSLCVLIALDTAPTRWEPHPGWESTLLAALAACCLQRRRLVLGALLAAGAYAFKQNTGAFMLIAVLARGGIRDIAPTLATFAAITLAWLVPLVIALHGDLGLLTGFVGDVNQAGLFSPPEWSMLVPLACIAGGLLKVRDQPWLLVSGVCLFLTQFPRMDTLHLVWSAPLLLVVGAVALDRSRPVVGAISVAVLVAMTLPVVLTRTDVLSQPLVPFGRLMVPRQTAQDLTAVIADVRQRTQAGEAIFVYPSSPLVYVLAERPNATRWDHLNPGAASPSQVDQAIASLQPVRVVVVSDFWIDNWGPPGPNVAVQTYIDANYREVARDGTYRVLVHL